MSFTSSILATFHPGDRSNRRRGGRLPLEAVRCGAGTVIDISGTGMKIRSRCEVHGYVQTTLQGLGSELTILAQVAWCRKVGFMKYEAGLQFVEMDDATRQALLQFTAVNRNCRSM